MGLERSFSSAGVADAGSDEAALYLLSLFFSVFSRCRDRSATEQESLFQGRSLIASVKIATDCQSSVFLQLS